RMCVALGGVGLGLARSSLDVAAQFATERVQFGVPIAEKQAVQNLIAESAVEVEALQHLVYHAAWRTDRGRGGGKGGHRLGYDASVLKVFAARVARGVTDRMVQVMGGYGYMEDYPLARKYRDARALGLVGGATELHMVRIAAGLFSGSDVEIVP
ncbi:MAG: acyl-CoA dehydrogenase family protein, partial [Chloroflexota bacterium]